MNLGRAIHEILGRRGLQQTDLAGRVHLSPNYIGMLIHNKRDARHDTIMKVATAMGVPVSFLYILADEDPDPLIQRFQEAVRRNLGNLSDKPPKRRTMKRTRKKGGHK